MLYHYSLGNVQKREKSRKLGGGAIVPLPPLGMSHKHCDESSELLRCGVCRLIIPTVLKVSFKTF